MFERFYDGGENANDSNEITASDVLALGLLSVRIAPQGLIQLFGPLRTEIADRL